MKVVEQDGFVLRTTESKSVMCGFGTYECSDEGFIYHWKLKVLEGGTVPLLHSRMSIEYYLIH